RCLHSPVPRSLYLCKTQKTVRWFTVHSLPFQRGGIGTERRSWPQPAGYFPAAFRGRPPLAPFARDARAFAALVVEPAIRASSLAAWFRPNDDISNPGTLTSASTASQASPEPPGNTSTRASSAVVARSSP